MPATETEVLERCLRAALGALPQTRSLAAAQLRRLPGGTAARGWCLETPQRRYFARHDERDARALGADAAAERELMLLAAAAGIAPRVVHFEPAAGLLVTDYVDGRVWSDADFADAASLRRLGALLGRLHSLKAGPDLSRVDFRDRALRLSRHLDSWSPARPAAEIQLHADAVWARLARRRSALVPCHNDVQAHNLIEDDGRAWLLDWEYGGLGDPLFDLAPVYARTGRRRELLDAFHAGYGPVDEGSMRAVADACWAYDHVQWLWYRAWLGGQGVSEPGASAAVELRIGDLESRLRQPP